VNTALKVLAAALFLIALYALERAYDRYDRMRDYSPDDLP
jgi:hypothetical protein